LVSGPEQIGQNIFPANTGNPIGKRVVIEKCKLKFDAIRACPKTK
jgi:hypothetical protein